MPQLGETVTEGTITKWYKAVGDTVDRDEPLFEVSTDKVDSEVPSPAAGVLTAILVEEGDTVDVGVTLAVIGEDGATAGSPSGDGATTAAAEAAPERTVPVVQRMETALPDEPALAPKRSPLAPPTASPAAAAPPPSTPAADPAPSTPAADPRRR